MPLSFPTFGGARRGGSAGTLTGANPTGYSPGFGGIPQVPDPGATAANAVSSNLSNLPSILQLAGGVNTFNTQAMQHALETGLPDYRNLITQSSENIGQELKGDLPQDVINLIGQQAAERGIATGSPGSPNANAAYLRALGLTSLDMMGRGESALTTAIGRTPMPNLFNIPSQLISPDQVQEAQMAANLYRSAPIPSAAAGAGIGAFESGFGRGSTPTLNWSGGGLGFGGPTDPVMQMYNAPWASDAANPPAVGGTGTWTGTEPTDAGYNNWAQLASSWYNPGVGVNTGGYIPMDLNPYFETDTSTGTTPMDQGELSQEDYYGIRG